MTIQKRIINEAFFDFKHLKNFLQQIAGLAGSSKEEKAEELGIDLSQTGKVPPKELKVIAKKELEKIYNKFNVKEREVFSIFKGESNFDTKAFASTGAVGLFQVMPKTAKDLGTSSAQVHNMTAVEQVNLYYKYLLGWSKHHKTSNFSGKLGVLQAAPALADKKKNEVIYPKGSPEWKANRPWRPQDGGDITVASIADYYARKA